MAETPTDLELAYMQWLTQEEQARERAIIQMRAFYDGDQQVYLTERMKRVLGTDTRLNLNLVRTVVQAVAELLIVNRFDCPDEAVAQWARDVWRANRMDQYSSDVHEGILRDGEYFVIVDWDSENKRPRFTPHQRYTDPTVFVSGANSANGDGFGCRAYYPNDDDSQPMEYACKRWTEDLGSGKARQRMTRYYPDRIEKYASDGLSWIPITDPEDNQVWPLPWVDAAGKPLGIPVVHFRNPGLRPEAWDALPIQKMLNKLLVDLLMSADITAFRIFVALGFVPTSDGEPPRKNARGEVENALDIEPGQVIGTTRAANEAEFRAIEPAQLTPLLDAIEKAINWIAMVTDTPLSRFQVTRQVASSESQKESRESLFAKARNRQIRFGNSWEDCLAMARRLANTFGNAGLDDGAAIETVWAPLETRSVSDLALEWKAKREAGIPREQLWSEMGYSAEQITAMKQMPEYVSLLQLMQMGMKVGG